MTLPYYARLMLLPCPTEQPIELTRFKTRVPQPADVRHWTTGLASPWWIERPMTDYATITSRPDIRPLNLPGMGQHRPSLRLRPEEHGRLETAGVKPEYKT